MQFTYTTTMLPLLLAGLTSFGVAFYVGSQGHQTRQSRYFVALSVAIGIWATGYAFEIAGADLPSKVLWAKIEYLGITSLPVFWSLFAFSYARRPLQRWAKIALAVIPAITVILVFLPSTQSLVWTHLSLETQNGFLLLAIEHGPWFWVHNLYSQFLLLYSTYLLLTALWRKENIFRQQLIIMMIGLMAPWAGNITYILGVSPIPHLDLTPFGFTITVLAFTWGIFGYQLIKLAPVAREMVVDALQDGVIVLDNDHTVIDINQAASAMIGVPRDDATGQSILELMRPWPELVQQFKQYQGGRERTVITIGAGESQRSYEVVLTPISGGQNVPLGVVISLHSLTPDAPLPQLVPVVEETSQQTTAEAPADSPAPGNFWQRLVRFYTVPETSSPASSRYLLANERALTIILRLSATIGLAALLVAPNFDSFSERLPILLVVIGLWALGIMRRQSYSLRLGILLWLLYILAVTEVWRFGFSLESMVFFMAFIMTNALLNSSKQAWYALGATILTMSFGAWLILSGRLSPAVAYALPDSPAKAITAILTLSAVSSGLILMSTLLTNSMRQARLREQQARHLVQQERDLLEQRVRERTQEIENARQALELAYEEALQANQAKTQLLASVSHELRTPLGAIMGFADLLQMDAESMPPDKQDMLAQISQSTRYLAHIVNDLLDEAQLTKGDFKIESQPFSPYDLFQDLYKQLKPLAEQKRLNFTLEIDPAMPQTLYGDAYRLKQIAINIIGNAIKFTEVGQVQIKVSPLSDTNLWQFEVRDTGPGINPEHQKIIFEPFRQLEETLTRQHRGTGLGLAIARQLVELMHGDLLLESTPGQGSTFIVTLPVKLS